MYIYPVMFQNIISQKFKNFYILNGFEGGIGIEKI